MPGFNRQRKLVIIYALRQLRRQRRASKDRLTFQDIESLIWDLPPSGLERFFEFVSKKISAWQGKK